MQSRWGWLGAQRAQSHTAFWGSGDESVSFAASSSCEFYASGWDGYIVSPFYPLPVLLSTALFFLFEIFVPLRALSGYFRITSPSHNLEFHQQSSPYPYHILASGAGT